MRTDILLKNEYSSMHSDNHYDVENFPVNISSDSADPVQDALFIEIYLSKNWSNRRGENGTYIMNF